LFVFCFCFCFYLPTFADFIGRIYTLSQYLSYQGDDLCRSLLLFADNKSNKPLDEKGFNYLLFYFSNLYGNKILNYNDRIQWSKDNVIIIYEMFINDINKFNSEVLPKLKESFQFISIMFATIRCLNSFYENEDIILNNPILFNASCNGLQHLSALTREVDIAIKTNLVLLPDSPVVKNDFYLYAASLIQAEDDKCDILRKLNITRAIIKKTVMTIPYNITLYGVKEQIREKF
jgi:DNA-directed RNA polymerase, mitochondrial